MKTETDLELQPSCNTEAPIIPPTYDSIWEIVDDDGQQQHGLYPTLTTIPPVSALALQTSPSIGPNPNSNPDAANSPTAPLFTDMEEYQTTPYYNTVPKPNFISPLLHFRLRQIFLNIDTQMTGSIPAAEIFTEVPRLFYHLQPANQDLLKQRLTSRMESQQPLISLAEFYTLLEELFGKYVVKPSTLTRQQVQQATQVAQQQRRNSQQPDELQPWQSHLGPDQVRDSVTQKEQTVAEDKHRKEMNEIKNQRRKSRFVESLGPAGPSFNHNNQDFASNIAQFENSDWKNKRKQTCCKACTAYIICPVATMRFPFMPLISAKFGSSFVRFFEFIASFIWLNLILGLLSLLILIPAVSNRPGFGGPFPWDFSPYPISRYIDGVNEILQFIPNRIGFFLGTGLEQSFLFYSDYYSPPNWNLLGRLDLSLIWTLLPILLFIVSAVFVMAHLSQSVSTVTNETTKLVQTVFSFDHRPQREQTQELQALHLKSSLYSLTSLLREKQYFQQNKQFLHKQYKLQFRRFLGGLLNLIALAGFGACIIFLTIKQNDIARQATDQLKSNFMGQWAVPLMITGLKIAVPFVVSFCVWIEQRDIIGQFKHTSVRIYLCKVFFIFVVLFQTQSPTVSINEINSTITCRQTLTSIMFYKMLTSDVIVDFLLAIAIPLLFFISKLILYRCCRRSSVKPLPAHPTYQEIDKHLYSAAVSSTRFDLYRTDFVVVEALVDALYTQILIWVGLPYTPPMAILGFIYFFSSIGARLIQILALSRMPMHSIPQHIQTNLMNLFLSLSLGVAILSYTVFFSTNTTCGPHLFSPTETNGNSPMVGLIEQIQRLPQFFTVLINAFGSPIILLCILGLLITVSLTYRVTKAQYDRDGKQLSLWLQSERQQIKQLRKQYNFAASSVSYDFMEKIANGGEFDETKPLVGRRAKQLLVEYLQELPDNISSSFQYYLSAICYIDDISTLLLLEPSEFMLLLEQWNSSLTPQSPLAIYMADCLEQFRDKFAL